MCDIHIQVYNLSVFYFHCVGRDTSGGVAIRYGLGGLGIECRWRRDFPRPSRPSLGPNQPPIKRVLGLFTGGKAAGS